MGKKRSWYNLWHPNIHLEEWLKPWIVSMGIAILRSENWTFQTRRRTAVRVCTCTRRKTSDTVKTVRANVALLAYKQTLGNEVISGGSFVFLHIVNISQTVQDSSTLKKSIWSPETSVANYTERHRRFIYSDARTANVSNKNMSNGIAFFHANKFAVHLVEWKSNTEFR